MELIKHARQRVIQSYHLSPQQMEELHRKYGRPGEMAPGHPAPKKRNRFESALAAMDRKDKNVIIPFAESGLETSPLNQKVHLFSDDL